MRRVLFTVVLALVGSALAQEYRFLIANERDTLDPLQAFDPGTVSVVMNLYEGLYGFDGDDAENYAPHLATGHELSVDGLAYTFSLREGVRFHSGNPFTCRDVEYTYKRALVVNPADSGAYVLSEVMIGEEANALDALGEDASDEEFADYWARIYASVECLDEHTARVHVLQDSAAAFARLMVSSAHIVDSAFAKEHGMWDGTEATWRDWIGVDLREHHLHANASGTGAYRLVSWGDGAHIEAEANPEYWGGPPQIQRVTERVVDDTDERIEALLAGEATVIVLGDRSELPRLKGQPGVVVYDELDDARWANPNGVWALNFNLAMGDEQNPFIGSGRLDGEGVPADFFADRDARRCFAFAFDGRAATERAFGDVGVSYTMALPSSFLGYDATIPLYTLDPVRAEKHCRDAWGGQLWEHGMALTLPYRDTDDWTGEIARALQGTLEAMNPRFSVTPLAMPRSEYREVDPSHYPLELTGWGADYGDPDTFISAYYASGGYYAGWYGYSNPEIDALNELARSTRDARVRAQLYGLIGWLGYEDAALVVLPEFPVFSVVSDKLQNYHKNPMIPNLYLWRNVALAD